MQLRLNTTGGRYNDGVRYLRNMTTWSFTEELKMSSSSNRRKRRKEPEVIVFQEPASSSMGLKRGREAARERQKFLVRLVYCVGVAISLHLHVYPTYLCPIYDLLVIYYSLAMFLRSLVLVVVKWRGKLGRREERNQMMSLTSRLR